MTIQPRYEILTQRMPDTQIIAQQVNVVGPSPDDPAVEVRETIICQMINLADESIRQKLIELGWTPPDTESLLKVEVQQLLTLRQQGGWGLPPKLHDAIAALAQFIK